MVIEVMRNMMMSGKTPSMIRRRLLNGDGVPGRAVRFWNISTSAR